MIKKCTCEHKYQDKLYGKKMRVFNQTKQNEHEINKECRCTVCKKERN